MMQFSNTYTFWPSSLLSVDRGAQLLDLGTVGCLTLLDRNQTILHLGRSTQRYSSLIMRSCQSWLPWPPSAKGNSKRLDICAYMQHLREHIVGKGIKIRVMFISN